MNRLVRSLFTFMCVLFSMSMLWSQNDASNALSIFIRGSSSNAADADDSRIIEEIETRTGIDIRINWSEDPAFSETLSLNIANNTLDAIVVASKTPIVLKGIEEGKFWEISQYISEYPNLATINPIILDNLRINGQLFGLPKTRPLGRNGVVYRQDWLNNLNMEKPQNLDDFSEMLRAFTEDDPDGNGLDDTYGMVLTSYKGSLDQISVWFGGPQDWGFDSSGNLVPKELTEGYRESIRFLRNAYENGYINDDFPIFNPSGWNAEVSEGRAGVIVDITDRARGIAQAAQADGRSILVDVQGAFEGPEGYRVQATSGFAGMLLFSKSALPTEEDLRRALSLMDYLSSDEGRNLLLLGIEGEDWELSEQGYTTLVSGDEKNTIGADTGQLMIFPSAPAAESTGPRVVPGVLSIESEVRAENENYLVVNPAIGYTSDMQNKRGRFLQAFLDDARIRFIIGAINEAEYEAMIEAWRNFGGDTLIAQINQIHSQAITPSNN